MAPDYSPKEEEEVPGEEELEAHLFSSPGLTGAGQLEIRMALPPTHPDPDILSVARRLKSYHPESWHFEWARVAAENEERARRFEAQGRKVTAHEYFRRATDFYRRALLYLPEAEPRMIPTYQKVKSMFQKAWELVPPPFEQVEIPYEGHRLEALFYPVRGKAGKRYPVVYNYAGADGILYRGDDGGAGAAQYVKRGMAFIDVDGPGHGGALRLQTLYAPPDAERVAKAVIDYLETRSDVDPSRIGIHGSSMGGYAAPRCAAAEPRIRAVAVWSGAYSLREDIFDYYPPIRERLRWLTGAGDFREAREKIAAFTLEGRVGRIQCPMLVGYSKDDRIMDPRGALRLYQKAVNSRRRMLGGVGHGEKRFDRRSDIADWFMGELEAEAA